MSPRLGETWRVREDDGGRDAVLARVSWVSTCGGVVEGHRVLHGRAQGPLVRKARAYWLERVNA